MRGLIVCPGRGSYGRAELGRLPAGDPTIAAVDRFRAGLGRPTITELDRAPAFQPALHVAGEHASLLTFACTAVDLAAIDRGKVDVVGVTGNSMGWYTALYAAGALDLGEAARLVETLGHYQAGNVIGHQLIYPLTDDDWRPAPAARAAIDEVLTHPGVFTSIRLGGAVVLATDDAGLAYARRTLPPVLRGSLTYPLPLLLHSAFHSPLLADTAARARDDLADLAIRAPHVTLYGGDGVAYPTWADPRALWTYTLGAQIVEPFDLELAVATAVGELGPDALILPGPGDTLGSALAQILISRRWRGLRDRQDFLAAQASDRPLVLSMSRPDQRARVV